MPLKPDQRERYGRHLELPEIGEKGQEKLLNSSVLVVGVGGLGSPVALYLAAAGVGRLGLADGDRVHRSNLQRQILHFTGDIGELKTQSAAAKLSALNPDVKLMIYPERLDERLAMECVREYDFVVEATDNFTSKFLVADVCHRLGKPYSHAGILRFTGQTITVHPGLTACYRCVFQEEPPPVPAPGVTPQGPLGTLPGVIGTIQATEAIKHILGIGRPLVNCLLVYDALEMNFRKVKVNRSPDCQLCGGR